jgi:hypothetical protein
MMSWITQILDRLMPRKVVIGKLDNMIQAQQLSLILAEEEIPHKIVRHGEALWGYADGIATSWGHLETAPEFQDVAGEIYRDFLASEPEED